MKNNKKEFIFIGGTGRSGTTILSKVLNSHKECNRLPFELRFHIDPNGLYDLYRNLCDDWDVYRGSAAVIGFEKFYDKLLGFSSHSYHNITLKSNPKSFYKKALDVYFENLGIVQEKRLWIGNSPIIPKSLSLVNSKLARKLYPEFYITRFVDKERFYKLTEEFFKKIFQKELDDRSYLIEHTPYNFLFFGFLDKVFPNSKFIHIKRNPFDIISSYSTQNWGSENINSNAEQIIDLYSKWLSKKPSLTNFLEISLEDLGNNSESCLQELSDYLGTNVDDFDRNSIAPDKLHIDRWKENEEYYKSLPTFKRLKDCAKKMGYEVF